VSEWVGGWVDGWNGVVRDMFLATGVLLLNVVREEAGLVSHDFSPTKVVKFCSKPAYIHGCPVSTVA